MITHSLNSPIKSQIEDRNTWAAKIQKVEMSKECSNTASKDNYVGRFPLSKMKVQSR